MSDPDKSRQDTKIALIQQEMESLKSDHREAIEMQKQTNKITQELTQEIRVMVHKIDTQSDRLRAVEDSANLSKERLDKSESQIKILGLLISAIVVGAILVDVGLK